MTVQELIDTLQQVEDKTLPVTIDTQSGYDSVENVEVDSLYECEKYGWVNSSTRRFRKVVLLTE